MSSGGLIYEFIPLDFTDPARLWELEGECQEKKWHFGKLDDIWVARCLGEQYQSLTEPAIPEGRVRLILRAWLEMSDTLPA